MKSTITSIILFIVMMASIFLSINYINSISNKLVFMCDTLENNINNEQWKKSYTLSLDLFEEWKKHYRIISLYVNSSELDTLNNEIVKLTQYIECETQDEALATTHTIKFMIKQVQAMQKINLQNIF
ncbi:hypothetical protein CLTEP_19940 [Clostridium tepidiprofundi DSM 19306]|uniref:DUF4363 family protein n=1 Tax=Clostridium tepidiprofundi DSM 19306 TaxID=1121338 RepID=A0A151B2B7_9CLOT|nr:DUF4363 family protein [Clostridium tepidiprofundi]KYH34048.1 hypothetical protein CLTEP_19940 [Clostridium tepidiprofundi DSM 19306]